MIQFIPKISSFLPYRSQHLTLQQFSPISVLNFLKYPPNSQTVKTMGLSVIRNMIGFTIKSY